MENSFSSPRSDAFPAGLRVLVVDDDPTWLKILEKMLKKCSYEVTTCGLARDALRLLRERKDGFDIVISDVNMPDMDGFKLLEHVGLEMDLPVIMMSVDGETSRVMKGVQHGACDYLLKPIRMKELKNIWQHVFRKKIHEIRDIESHESLEAMLTMRNGSEHCDDGQFLGAEDSSSARKRKDGETRHDDRDCLVGFDAASAKKARVVWSVDLHQKFVKAVNQIGFEKVGPKKILDLMNVPWLTRENVASHLQKYRLYLSRLQKEKENESKSSLVMTNQSDGPPKEPHQGGFVLQSSTNTQPIEALNGSYRLPSNTSLEDDLKGSSQIGLNQLSFAAKYSYAEASEIRFVQEQKPLFHLENSFTKLPLPDKILPRVHVDSKLSIKSTRPVYPEYGSNQITHNQALEPIYTTSTSTMTLEALNCFSIDFESAQRRLGDDDDDDFQVFQCDYNGFSDYTADPVLVNDVPIHLCDSRRFGFEYPYYDPTEYATIDQSLLT